MTSGENEEARFRDGLRLGLARMEDELVFAFRIHLTEPGETRARLVEVARERRLTHKLRLRIGDEAAQIVAVSQIHHAVENFLGLALLAAQNGDTRHGEESKRQRLDDRLLLEEREVIVQQRFRFGDAVLLVERFREAGRNDGPGSDARRRAFLVVDICLLERLQRILVAALRGEHIGVYPLAV